MKSSSCFLPASSPLLASILGQRKVGFRKAVCHHMFLSSLSLLRSKLITVGPGSTVEQLGWSWKRRGRGLERRYGWGRSLKFCNLSNLLSGPHSALEDLGRLCYVNKERTTEALDVCCRSTSVPWSWSELIQPCVRRFVTPIWMAPIGRLFLWLHVLGHAHGVSRLKSYHSPLVHI